jgi:YD repeat-containing protein
MRSCLLATACLLAAGLVWLAVSQAGPVGGGLRPERRVKLDPGAKIKVQPIRFKGNERACVFLIGDHDPDMDLAIYIYDEKGNLVAKDDAGGDFCAAIWYPPHTAAYTIELESRGNVYNLCYLSIK